MEVGKFISGLKQEKFTLMIVPAKRGTTRTLNINKLLIVLSAVVLVLVIILISLLMVLNYQNSQSILELQKTNEDHILNIKTLQNNNQIQQEQIRKYQNDQEIIQSKLKEIQELETKIKSLIEAKDSSFKPSRGENPLNTLVINDVFQGAERLTALVQKVDNFLSERKKIPSMLPCTGEITSNFGYRKNPFSRSSSEFHPGVDIADRYGTPIYAAADGIVSHSAWLDGYGFTIIINHENGYESVYGHNSKLVINQGQVVKKGDKIAQMGSSGRSTGTHCHFEIRLDSKPVNPMDLLKE